MVKKYKYKTIQQFSVHETLDILVIPDMFKPFIERMVNEDNETCGYIIYNKEVFPNNTIMTVEQIFATDKGTPFSVSLSKSLNLSEEYGYIEFHTHSVGTGQYWYEKFSSGDFNTFYNRENEGEPKYRHVLFTPTHILTYGEFRLHIAYTNEKTRELLLEKGKQWKEVLLKKS